MHVTELEFSFLISKKFDIFRYVLYGGVLV